jgi:hypothetical protein
MTPLRPQIVAAASIPPAGRALLSDRHLSLRGEWTSLPVEAQELLASWICKIAMVADQAGKEAGFSQGDREYLHRYRKPPLGFWIWVTSGCRICGTHGRRRTSCGETRPMGVSTPSASTTLSPRRSYRPSAKSRSPAGTSTRISSRRYGRRRQKRKRGHRYS